MVPSRKREGRSGLTRRSQVGRAEPGSLGRVCCAEHYGMRVALGQIMAQTFAGNRRLSSRATGALVFGAALMLSAAMFSTTASAQLLGYASPSQSSFPSDNMTLAPTEPALSDDGDGSGSVVPERLRRAEVAFNSREARGTVIIDTGNPPLYYVLGQGRAIRYGVGVGRDGFTWSGVQTISRKAEWPDWHPPAEMIARQPYLPRFVAGGPNNPLGARALYLGHSQSRIHGTNDPSTIGHHVSSGCIRLTNDDVADLFGRVGVGTKVVVLPQTAHEARGTRADARPARPQVVRTADTRQTVV